MKFIQFNIKVFFVCVNNTKATLLLKHIGSFMILSKMTIVPIKKYENEIEKLS